MRIVHLANHTRNRGNGIVNMMIDLACSQAKAGHDVTVATSGGDFDALLENCGVKNIRVPQSLKLSNVFRALIGFRRVLRQCKPDVVHAHMMTGALLGRFGAIGRKYALVTTVHNEFQKTASLMRLGDRVVCVSAEVAKSMQNRGVPTRKISIIRNGTIGTPRRSGKEPTSPQLQRPSIVTVAGMYERKGIGDLLRAFVLIRDQNPQAHLYLVGDGPDKQVMESAAQELGLAGRVTFTGFVSDPRGYLDEADIFVQASHKEAGALALIEARECGCAIVATNVDGNPEMLDFGEAGLLVPAKSPESLSDAIGRLLSDPALLREYRQRSQSNLRGFHVSEVSNNYLSVYAQTLAER